MSGASTVREGASGTGVRRPGRARRPGVTAAVAALGFTATTVLVATDGAQDLDARTKRLFRPHGEWGATQLRYDHVVEGLSPEHLLIVLLAVTVVAVLARRSWEPVGLVALPMT